MDLTNKHRPLICVDPTKTGGKPSDSTPDLKRNVYVWANQNFIWHSVICVIYIYSVCVERAEVKSAKHGAEYQYCSEGDQRPAIGVSWDQRNPRTSPLDLLHPNPIGSMYAIYGNIYHPYTPNVSIYTSTMDPMVMLTSTSLIYLGKFHHDLTVLPHWKS